MQANIAIDELMDQMHAAILAADYDELAPLSEAVDNALLELGQTQDPALLLRIQHKAARNAACAQAAGRGVRAAIRRLEEVRKISGGLVTYDVNGHRNEQNVSGELSRRL